jgi:hypothetical protein
MVEIKVDPGICGMQTIINADSDDERTATIDIKSECEFIRSIAGELKEVDAFEECFTKICNTKTYTLANEYCKHPACPVPSAILKSIEVACGLALPKDVEMKIINF